MLHELSSNKRVAKMFVNENRRMSYEENILRFFALRDYMKYKNSMKQQLNEYMDAHQNDDEITIKRDRDLFNKTLAAVAEILGEDAFYNVDYEKKDIF